MGKMPCFSCLDMFNPSQYTIDPQHELCDTCHPLIMEKPYDIGLEANGTPHAHNCTNCSSWGDAGHFTCRFHGFVIEHPIQTICPKWRENNNEN